VPSGTKVTFVDRANTENKQVLELGHAPSLEHIKQQLKVVFNLFEKDVFIYRPDFYKTGAIPPLEQSRLIGTQACWHSYTEQWEVDLHRRKGVIVGEEINAVRKNLSSKDDTGALIHTLMSVWEIACQQENCSFIEVDLLARLCNLLVLSKTVENCRYVVAANAAAIWMIASQCRGRRRRMIEMRAIPKLLQILDNLWKAPFHKERDSAHSKQLQEAFPDDKHQLYVVGALAMLCQETAGRVQMYHNNGLEILLTACLRECAVGYVEPKKVSSSALLNLVATHSSARKDCMRIENLEKVCKMLEDHNLYVVEMAIRILCTLMKNEKWAISLYHHSAAIINHLVKSVKWAYAHLLDDEAMNAMLDINEHDVEAFEEVIVHVVNFGVATIWGLAYKLNAFVDTDGSNVHILQVIDADSILEYFAQVTTHTFDDEASSSIQTSASGIVCLMSAFRSTLQVEPAKFEYEDVYSLLLEISQEPGNLAVYINAICGIAQLLTRTFQTPDQQHAIDAALKANIWETVFGMLRNQQALLHESESSQVAAASILMYLSQYVTEVCPADILVLEMMLEGEWAHIHVYIAACVWGLSQDAEKRRVVAQSDQILNKLVDGMKGISPLATIESREWAAGAIFVLMRDRRFQITILTTRLADIIGVLVDGTGLVKDSLPVGGNESGDMKGDTERTLWTNSHLSISTSSTLLFCVVGSLWKLAVDHDAALVLSEYPLAKTVTALALYVSQTSCKYPIKCPKLRRYCVGLAQCLWGYIDHQDVMKATFREDIMEFLFVDLLDATDSSSQCDAAIGLSICAMEWERKTVISKLGAIAKLVGILDGIAVEDDGCDLQYCVLQSLLNLSQNRKNQIAICRRALRILVTIADTTKNKEVFCLGRAIIANIEKNRGNKERFHKFRLTQTAISVIGIERRFGGDSLRASLRLAEESHSKSLPLMSPAPLNRELLTQEPGKDSDGFISSDPLAYREGGLNSRPSTSKFGQQSVNQVNGRAQTSHSTSRKPPPWNSMGSLLNTSFLNSENRKKSMAVCESMSTLRNSLTSQLTPNFDPSLMPKLAKEKTSTIMVPTTERSRSVSFGDTLPPVNLPLNSQQQGEVEEVVSTTELESEPESGGIIIGNTMHDFESEIEKEFKPPCDDVHSYLKSPRLRSGPQAIEKWAVPNTWAPRVSAIDIEPINGTRVSLAASRISRNNMRFGKQSKKKNLSVEDDDALITLAKFDHTEGSKVYKELFNTYQPQTGESCHFYQKSNCPYEAVLVPYPSPCVHQHGLGQKGYLWPETPFGFQGLCKDGYPKSGQASLLNPVPGFVPPLSCPKAMKAPTPAFHSIQKSKNLYNGHRVFKKKNIEESDSPFFGVFPDNEMVLYVDIRDEYKAPIEVIETISVPFRGDGWQIETSIWNDRLKDSDSRDYWDDDNTYDKAFQKDWDQISNLPRVQKLITRLDKGVRIENQVLCEHTQ